jgi:hypothetical protein
MFSYETVPVAVKVYWRGRFLFAIGFPLRMLFPGLVAWLDMGVPDL